VAIEAMRGGPAMGVFQAWQQATTMHRPPGVAFGSS
jgi:hypothetical protein